MTLRGRRLYSAASRLIKKSSTPFEVSTIKSCSTCSKPFATSSALSRHQKLHQAEHVCRSCNSSYTSSDALDAHRRKIHADARPKYSCVACGESFLRYRSLLNHLSKLPKEHDRLSLSRSFTRDDFLDDRTFSDSEHVIDNSMHHATSVSSCDSIRTNSVLRASKLTSSPYIGMLSSDQNAPPCSYFSVTPASYGSIPFVTSVSPRHEPGEVCASLVVNMNSLRRESSLGRLSKLRMFFMGASLTESSPSYRQNLRAVVLLTRDPHVQQWASENSIELNLEENPLLCAVPSNSSGSRGGSESRAPQDVSKGRWMVATKCKIGATKGGWRPLQVVVALSGDTNLQDFSNGYRWHTVYQVEENNRLYRCPICEVDFHTPRDVNDHTFVVHNGGSFNCMDCGASYRHRSSLNSHRRASHSDRPAIVCRTCGKEFSWRSQLQRHRKACTPESRQ